VTDEEIREQAVRNVDARHGYTVEFSIDPRAHRDEYDAEEERLRDERLQARMRDHYRANPPENAKN
jgi:hypothetical protein